MFIPGTRHSPARICLLLMACLIAAGCILGKKPAASSSTRSVPASDGDTPPAPEAKIGISYSRPGDFLSLLTVTQYSGAQTVFTDSGKGPLASIIRFEGGIVIWQIGVAKGLLADVPMLGEHKPYALTTVVYGKLPANFVSTIPESGPPPPLEADHYYVFTVVRGSGATSYEAVKVNGDGSLEAYAAEPRAGDSFRLCCDLAPDFVINANTLTNPANP
jgi:hypothetical protein